MSIENSLRMIERLKNQVDELKNKYAASPMATLELNKLHQSLQNFHAYLIQLDHLQPDYNTNEINTHVEAINLHLAILKEELAANDYALLNKTVKILKAMLKFHPKKYSFFAYLYAWLLELFIRL